MNRGESCGRKVGEEPVDFVIAYEIGEFIVPPINLVSSDETPFADMNPFIRPVNTLVGEGITVNNVLLENVTYRFNASLLAF